MPAFRHSPVERICALPRTAADVGRFRHIEDDHSVLILIDLFEKHRGCGFDLKVCQECSDAYVNVLATASLTYRKGIFLMRIARQQADHVAVAVEEKLDSGRLAE